MDTCFVVLEWKDGVRREPIAVYATRAEAEERLDAFRDIEEVPYGDGATALEQAAPALPPLDGLSPVQLERLSNFYDQLIDDDSPLMREVLNGAAPELDDDEAIEIAFYDAFKESVVELPTAAPAPAMDTPDGPGWWAWQEGEQKGVSEIYEGFSNELIVDEEPGGLTPDYFAGRTWHKLTMPWQRPATVAGEVNDED